ncbi:hypothetical protein C9374_009229 [Naegleria lovaniensis]|uniref:RGS domain-containing protein n=1 Tax=Naegleria lovaniensis TaxID=51637 RepID=A0AA88GJM5_NAELO|nr:uncharacterized protein C9374_009229 [Naegleria lovaniensis]KAG2377318.1 hypothetical protein C9374_009229 [Naegleria lovaniensis]
MSNDEAIMHATTSSPPSSPKSPQPSSETHKGPWHSNNNNNNSTHQNAGSKIPPASARPGHLLQARGHSGLNISIPSSPSSSKLPQKPSSPSSSRLPNYYTNRSIHVGSPTSDGMMEDFHIFSMYSQHMLNGEFSSNQGQYSECLKTCLSSLRVKTMSILFLTFASILIICLIGLGVAFHLSFDEVENKVAIETFRKTSRAIEDDFRMLLEKVYDYAAWDESFFIMKDNDLKRAQGLMETYFLAPFMERAAINYAGMYYSNGTMMAGVGAWKSRYLKDIPYELKQLDRQLLRESDHPETRSIGFVVPEKSLLELLRDEDRSTYLNDTQPATRTSNVLQIGLVPIQPNNNSVTCGFFMYGKYVSLRYVHDMSIRTQMCTSFFDVLYDRDALRSLMRDFPGRSEGELKQFFEKVESTKLLDYKNDSWTKGLPFHVTKQVPYDNEKYRGCPESSVTATTPRMATYQMFTDISGTHRILVRTDLPRDMAEVGWNSFAYSCLVLVAIVLGLTLTVMVFVECCVLRRVLKIGKTVQSITSSNDIKQRVPNAGRDELGTLCQDINRMLNALEESQSKLAKDNNIMQILLEKTALEEQKSRCVMNAIHDYIVTVECTTGVIINMNMAFEQKLLKKHTSDNSRRSLSENQIANYITEFESIERLLEHLESLSKSNDDGQFETVVVTPFGVKHPVSVNVTKAKMTLREGMIGDAYIIVLRNLSEQRELKSQLHQQQEKLEEMRKVSEFNNVMKDGILRNLLKEFAASEMSLENVEFLEHVEIYKSLSKIRDRSALQQEIIAKYLDRESSAPLNVSKHVIESEFKKIISGFGQLDLFDRLENIIKQMVINDTFSRFLVSKDYLDYINNSDIPEDTTSTEGTESNDVTHPEC